MAMCREAEDGMPFIRGFDSKLTNYNFKRDIELNKKALEFLPSGKTCLNRNNEINIMF